MLKTLEKKILDKLRRFSVKVSKLLNALVHNFQFSTHVLCIKPCSPNLEELLQQSNHHVLTGDASASNDLGEAEVNERVEQLLQMDHHRG